jgi:methionyl aminopeptidase
VIQLKSEAEIATMRAAGLVVARTLDLLRAAVAAGVSTADLDEVARESLRSEGAGSSFLGYHGFPAVICASINDEIVHGIPDPKRVLREGDIISLDFGAIIDGYHGDAAITVPVGDPPPELTELLRVTEESLWAGFAAAHLDGRMTDISHAVEASVRRSAHPYGIVEEYVGHGIGTEMHQDPQVPNFGRAGRGPKLERGLVLAIEPMVNLGSRHTRVLDDGWTVVTRDGKPSAHFEHTFTLTERGPWVLTAHDGGQARLTALGVSCGAPADTTAPTPQSA